MEMMRTFGGADDWVSVGLGDGMIEGFVGLRRAVGEPGGREVGVEGEAGAGGVFVLGEAAGMQEEKRKRKRKRERVRRRIGQPF